jgi:NAD(P)-dependent dehydrogenase (short-subunit alcohol dehydrogenase family)
MNSGLTGKVALITGGARDVGGDIALSLAAEGAAIAVNYRSSKDEAEALVAKITAAGGKAAAYQADVADYTAVRGMVASIIGDFGRLDVLVNNAGLAVRERFVDTTPDDWQKQIATNFYGVIHCCHAVAPQMIKQNSGRIICIIGDSSRIGESGLAMTGATRGGTLALAKSLAKELGRANITVNTVSLGLIETAHSDPAWMDANRDKLTKMYPLRRLGKPGDVAPLVTLLASENGSWITGQVISVNGGFAMV